jgi:hypothetical protein
MTETEVNNLTDENKFELFRSIQLRRFARLPVRGFIRLVIEIKLSL